VYARSRRLGARSIMSKKAKDGAAKPTDAPTTPA
jgi:hypothetical protein